MNSTEGNAGRKVSGQMFYDRDRYFYDWGPCRGWPQLDTNQDASYYGTWCHPKMLVFVSFIEGEETVIELGSEREFIKEINDWYKSMKDGGHNPRIDPGLKDEISSELERMGLTTEKLEEKYGSKRADTSESSTKTRR